MKLQRGFRDKIEKYVDLSRTVDLEFVTEGNREIDFCCFGLDQNRKLSDERFMVFYNQPKTPGNEIRYMPIRSGSVFHTKLSLLPDSIQNLAFTISIDGEGTLEDISSFSFFLKQGGEVRADFSLKGSELSGVKSLIAVEIYRKGDWRFSVTAGGFYGGLGTLLASFGGEEAKEDPKDPEAAKEPETSAEPSRTVGFAGETTSEKEPVRYCFHCMEASGRDSVCERCGRELDEIAACPDQLKPGSLLHESYLVGEALGSDGFGIRYIGRDLAKDRRVSIIEYFPQGLVYRYTAKTPEVTVRRDPEIYEEGRLAFLEEGEKLGSVQNSGIVKVLDSFQENHTSYMVTDYVEGIELEKYLRHVGQLSMGDALELLERVFQALFEIHKKGLVHKGISPESILIGKEGVMLTSFGMARNRMENLTGMTTMLNNGYTPVEQYEQDQQGPWTDVYALSAVLYRCVAGIAPVRAMERQSGRPLALPLDLGAAMNEQEQRILMKGMSVERGERYQTVRELYDALHLAWEELREEDGRERTVQARASGASPSPSKGQREGGLSQGIERKAFPRLCAGCMREKETSEGPCPFCGFDLADYHPDAKALKPYTILAGRYVLGRVLGWGGFGIVYLAKDLSLDVLVAIKELFPSNLMTRLFSEDDQTCSVSYVESFDLVREVKEKFIREARTVAALQTMNPDLTGMVRVSNLFEENQTAYMVMECLDGKNLKEYLEERGAIPFQEVMEILRPICLILEAIHQKGMTHRDISPDNIQMLLNGKVKLMDFGDVKVEKDGRQSTIVLVKPGYSPGEQYSVLGNIGPWSDIYALCATIYRMITGEKLAEPFDRLSNPSPLPSELGVEIPKSAEEALMKGLSFHPADRQKTIAELMEGLYPPYPEEERQSKGKGKGKGGWKIPGLSRPSPDHEETVYLTPGRY